MGLRGSDMDVLSLENARGHMQEAGHVGEMEAVKMEVGGQGHSYELNCRICCKQDAITIPIQQVTGAERYLEVF